MVYFLLWSFYETTICSAEGHLIRESIELEPLWAVLEQQKARIGVSAEVSVVLLAEWMCYTLLLVTVSCDFSHFNEQYNFP